MLGLEGDLTLKNSCLEILESVLEVLQPSSVKN